MELSGIHGRHTLVLEPRQPLPALEPGQLVRATVESVQGPTAQLRLLGTLIQARVQTPLSAGETLHLVVVTARPGLLHLRRVDPAPAPGPAEGGPRAGGAPLTAAAHPAAATQLAARALAAYRLPLAPEQVQRMASLLVALPPAQQKPAAAAAARLLAAGLPPLPAEVAALVRTAAGPRPWSLAQRLESLAGALEAAARALGSDVRVPNRPLAGRLLQLARELRAWGWHPPEPAAAEGTAPRPLPELLSRTEALLQELPEPVRAEPTAAHAELEEFTGALQRLAAPAGGGEEPIWSVFPVPLHLPHGEGELLILQRQGDGRGPATPEEAPHLHLLIRMPHLGELGVQLFWRAGAVHAVIEAADPTAAGALAGALPRLAEGLRRQGLAVGRLTARPEAPSPPAVLRPPAAELPQGIDIRL